MIADEEYPLIQRLGITFAPAILYLIFTFFRDMDENNEEEEKKEEEEKLPELPGQPEFGFKVPDSVRRREMEQNIEQIIDDAKEVEK
eukprot:CAMPEP_0196583554 /NCGR_PEP_ID=MMETSP1081-20130531/43902_1 /TAXON_ID=36882 /ORGANISM="Pyramimonas amylifera, Strain CCMP720" /LENGTH=86 /DNA_ID=CAMNT_0041904479 /DNA_START=436 /DNA_END=696 /DNA_ORIENTATION=-